MKNTDTTQRGQGLPAEPGSGSDWPEDFSDENGNYNCRCIHCWEIFRGHKRRVVCRRCAFFPCMDGEGNVSHDFIAGRCDRCGANDKLTHEAGAKDV